MKAQTVLAVFDRFLSGERDDAIGLLRILEAEESKAGRGGVAGKIGRLVSRVRGRPLMKLPNAPPSLAFMPGNRPLDSVVLAESSWAAVSELIREWRARELLAEHGLPMRKAVLLSGPSGNGKSTLAHAIATELDLPIGVARYEHLVASHIGETAVNLAKLFEFASINPCVLLIDEADALVSLRSMSPDGAGKENNRAVTSVILGLDAPASSLVVLATNFVASIDPAILRRCALQLELPAPDRAQRRRMCAILTERWPLLSRCNGWAQAVDQFDCLAAIEEHALAAARKYVLDKAEHTG